MIYELLIGFPPFTGRNTEDLKRRIREGTYGIPKNITLSITCVDFIDKCLRRNPDKRLEHRKLLLHPWFSEDGGLQIDLRASTIQDGPPLSTAFQVSEENAFMINIQESVIFNEMIAKQQNKYFEELEEEERKRMEEENDALAQGLVSEEEKAHQLELAARFEELKKIKEKELKESDLPVPEDEE